MYRDATVRSQIWPVRFAVGAYAVFGVLRLLAQVVQLNSKARNRKTEN